jgi:hypothetical protein
MSHTKAFEWKNQNSPTMKNARQLKSKVKSMLIIFFGFKGTAHTEFNLAG